MKIALGLHVAEAILPEVYFNHLHTMSKMARKHDLVLCGTSRIKVAPARNRIADQAIKEGCSHILFIDSDHILPDDMLDLLIESADAAMVSGLICKRQFPFEAVAFKFLPDGDFDEILIKERGKIIEVDGCAMGCTLVNLEHMQTLEKPYFYDARMRSDLNIAVNFRARGFKILIDARVSIGHLGDAPIITPENADGLRAQCVQDLLRISDE